MIITLNKIDRKSIENLFEVLKEEFEYELEQTRPSISRMKSQYNLEEGKLNCKCLIRKCCFYKHIRSVADGKVMPGLVKCPESSWSPSDAKEADIFLGLKTLTKLSQART